MKTTMKDGTRKIEVSADLDLVPAPDDEVQSFVRNIHFRVRGRVVRLNEDDSTKEVVLYGNHLNSRAK